MRPELPIAILGSKGVGLKLLQRVLVTANVRVTAVASPNDAADGRSELEAMRGLCEANAIPLTVDDRQTVYANLLAMAPRVVLVAGWYRLIPDTVLDSVENGFLGIHFSVLPKYRGSSPVVWALLNGEPRIGYSLFKLSSGMDEGLLAGQGDVPATDRYVGDVLEDLEAASTDHLARIAGDLAAGNRPLVAQPPGQPSYAGARRPSDGLIPWHLPAPDVARFVRAQSTPYPGAFTHADGALVRVWRARHETSCVYDGVPGQLVRLHELGPVVACGQRTGLLLEHYEVAGSEGQQADLKLRLGSLRFGSAARPLDELPILDVSSSLSPNIRRS